MNRSVFSDLYYKIFQSGNRLFLFIGINVLLFVVIKLVAVVDFLFFKNSGITSLLVYQLSMPAYVPNLALKFWTIVTYMFSHEEFFHILFNMLWLYWLGRIFLDFLNQKQFTFLYFAGGISGALLFIIAYNVFPVFKDVLPAATLIGASASVMAIVVATATLLPDYTISLLLLGPVKLKYIALVYVLMDILGIAGANPGGSIAHLGGAFIGFLYIRQLRSGNDWSKMFLRKRKMTIVKKATNGTTAKRSNLPDQDVIDTILDKISKSGYDSLSKKEKEQLFNASKKE